MSKHIFSFVLPDLDNEVVKASTCNKGISDQPRWRTGEVRVHPGPILSMAKPRIDLGCLGSLA